VLESRGGAVAGHAMTIRFSPEAGHDGRLRGRLRELAAELCARPGLTGVHLLQTDAPPIAPTTEQRIRGLADREADWILVATGYDARELRRCAGGELSAAALERVGAAPGATAGFYALRLSMSEAEVKDQSRD